MFISSLRLAIIATLVAASYGCAVKRERYEIPAIPVPAVFKQSMAKNAELEPGAGSLESKGAATRPEPLTAEVLGEWWRVLSNPELDALMDRVLANNADLRIASQRIVQAKVRADQARADQWPVLSLPFQAKGEGPRDGIGTVRPGGSIDTLHTYQMSLRADWRVDLWGERSAANESARMQMLRSTYQRDDIRRQLVASAASLYVEYLSLNDRVRVARETETVLASLLDGVGKRLEVGDATLIDFEQQRTAVYSVQATIPALELQRETVANALALLMGVTPVSLALSDQGLDSLNFPRMIPGVPASLVLRRPDVRVIETRLLSADADIDTARARILPPLDLTAQVGYGSFVLSQLFQNHSLFWNAIANMSATIFDYGKRSNEVVFARALHEELVETYVQVIYNAVRETDNALAAIQMTGKRIEAQDAATRAARRAWDYSLESYGAGAVDHLTLIDTERTYHRTLDELHRIRMERMKAVVALFAALGGGVPQADSVNRTLQLSKRLGQAETKGYFRPFRQYQPSESDRDNEFWLVELAGTVDRHGISHAWRDLNHRFPEEMRERSFLPRQHDRIANESRERSSWYRLYVARFDAEAGAASFCDRLLQELQRCRVVSSLGQDFIASGEVATDEMNAVTETDRRNPQPTKSTEDGLAVDSMAELVSSVTLQTVTSGKPTETIIATPGGTLPQGQTPAANFAPSLLLPVADSSLPTATVDRK